MGPMGSFSGGSAWAMARDIGEGVLLVTERTFGRFELGQVDQLAFELERALRTVRGEQAPLDDLAAIQTRNRKIQRLMSALTMLKGFKQRRFRRGVRPQFDGNT